MPPEDVTPQTPEPEPELTLDQHETQYARGGASVPEQDTEPGAEPAKSDQPARGRDDRGRFQPRERHRARSQQAGREDAPRIAELTKRLRAAETERDEWKTKASAPRSAESVDTQVGDAGNAAPTRATEPPREPDRRPAATTPPARPTPEDKKPDGTLVYDTWAAYEDALEEWREGGRQAQRAKEAEAARISAEWKSRTDAAKKKYDNFDEIALNKPTRIPPGSLVDAFILEDEAGADVLYHFQQNDAELDRVLAMTPFAAVKHLSLLSQRLSADNAEPVATGARATPREPVTRPPTPVRTGPTRAADEPPDPETATLAEHERYYGRSRDRR